MRLPAARGPITAELFARLGGSPDRIGPLPDCPSGAVLDDDLQLALFACYELHYQGFDGVDDRWEWEPSLLRARAVLESRFEDALARAVPRPQPVAPDARAPGADRAHRRRRRAAAGARSCSATADLEQFREFVVHRSHLPPQGGRPAHLGDPPAARRRQGRAGGDPGRRVRRRPPRADARRAVPRHHARPRPRRLLRRLPRPRARRSRWRSPTSCRCSGCTGGCAARWSATSPRSR